MVTQVRESALMPGWATKKELADIAKVSFGAMQIWLARHPEVEKRCVGNVNVYRIEYVLKEYQKR
jgi:hypothetical protein